MLTADLPTVGLARLNVVYHPHAGLPSCVTPVNTLTYYSFGSHAPIRYPQSPQSGKSFNREWVFSINCLDMGGSSPVRDYQPVVHRLRLSASP